MSDKSQKREQQMIEMQTRFDVNKLELEKSKETEVKRILQSE